MTSDMKNNSLHASIKVFISYASEDYELALRFTEDLKVFGLDPWLDKDSLEGGDRWKVKIKTAIRGCEYFIPLLSSKSVGNKGYVSKEWETAFDFIKNRSYGEKFVIPVKLDECNISHLPKKIKELHVIDLSTDWERGISDVIKAIVPDESDRERIIKDNIEKGNILAESGKHHEAIECFNRVIQTDPNNIIALNSKGYSLAEMGRHEEAIECFVRVTSIDPKNVRSYMNKGYSYAARGMYAEAIGSFKMVTEIEPKNSVAWANKGYCFTKLGNKGEAKDCYRTQKEIQKFKSSGTRKFMNLFSRFKD
jgi:tetratricopeptide (TPR) repeat protein